jgi:uncharacterized protein YyaL (SSP411 family)
LESPVQVVVIGENTTDDAAATLAAAATDTFAFNKTVLRLTENQAIGANLPPALAATIPNLPELKSGKAFAVVCSGFSCQPPIRNVEELRRGLESTLKRPA